MSNTICVELANGKRDYYPFRMHNEVLQALIRKEWVNVARTPRKNKYGDAIFKVIPIVGAQNGQPRT